MMSASYWTIFICTENQLNNQNILTAVVIPAHEVSEMRNDNKLINFQTLRTQSHGIRSFWYIL